MFEEIKKKLKQNKLTIVFPEGEDKRIIDASLLLVSEGLAKVILLGKTQKIRLLLNEDINDIEIIDPLLDLKIAEKTKFLYELRKGKNTLEECSSMIIKNNYYAVVLVKMKKADASVGGAIYSSGDIILPALQIIKGKKDNKLISSCFLLNKKNKPSLIMSDCAVNVDPTSEDLVEITCASVDTARLFGIDPKVALLSHSTKESAKNQFVDKVRRAVKILKEKQVNFIFDGEIQFDAATNKRICAQKAPNSPLKGEANVFIFPDLNSANIGYKIAQQLGGYDAVGPILQGLSQPINDLSRGCISEGVFKMALISLMQAINK